MILCSSRFEDAFTLVQSCHRAQGGGWSARTPDARRERGVASEKTPSDFCYGRGHLIVLVRRRGEMAAVAVAAAAVIELSEARGSSGWSGDRGRRRRRRGYRRRRRRRRRRRHRP